MACMASGILGATLCLESLVSVWPGVPVVGQPPGKQAGLWAGKGSPEGE